MTATTQNQSHPGGARTPVRAAVSSFLGSAVEYYDFFIYGTAAALVFNKVFFPTASAATGTLLALATFGVAYVARPIGAVVLGHFGDRLGRKKILVLTLGLMGMATIGIGLLPSYDTIGMAAPIALVALRILQGFSAAGEQSGAGSLSLEHAPDNRRAFVTSWTLSGTQAGLILATLVFIPVSALPKAELLSWGWRVPFLLSAVVLVVAFIVRVSLPETPVFAEAAETKKVERFPLMTLLRTHWADVLRVIVCAFIAMVSTITSVFGLAYATENGVSRSTMLWVVVVSNVVALVAQPLYALLADRVGRKPVFIGGVLACGIVVYPYFLALTSGNTLVVFLGGVLLTSVAYSAPNAVWPCFYGEMFSTEVRYSGMAVGTQLGFLLAGFTPFIGKAVQGSGAYGWVPVAVFTTIACVASAVAAATARETRCTPMHQLGAKRAPANTATRSMATAAA